MDKKRCKCCGQVKPLTDFYKHPTGKYGVIAICKECKKQQVKAKYHSQKATPKTYYYKCIICGKIKPKEAFIKDSKICKSCFKHRSVIPDKIKEFSMINNYPASLLVSWSQSAIDCLEIGCNCQKCFIHKIAESRCNMKKAVILLTRLHGTPEGYKEPTIIEEF